MQGFAGSAGEGSSIWINNANNSYSGTITVSASTGTGGFAMVAGANSALQYANVNLLGTRTSGATDAQLLYGVQFASGVDAPLFGSLAGNGNINLADESSTNVALTVGGNNASTTFSGILSGSGSLTKSGTGTMYLTGANTFLGGTTINGGTLNINADAALGAAAANLAFTGNGALQFGAANISLSSSRNVNVSGGVTATFDTLANSATIAGVIGDGGAGGAVQKLGSGNLTLAGNNAYSGGTNIGAGTLTSVGAGNLGTGNVAIANGALLNFSSSASQTFGGVISGSGALTQNGPGTITLTGANTYTGPTSINSNTTLVVNGGAGGALGNTAVSIAGSATLAIAGGNTAIAGNIATTAAGATINLVDGTGNTETLSANNLSLVPGSVLDLFVGGTAGQNDQIALSGGVSLTPGEGGTIYLSQPLVTAGTYGLLTAAAGGLTPGGTDFNLVIPAFHGSENLNRSTSSA